MNVNNFNQLAGQTLIKMKAKEYSAPQLVDLGSIGKITAELGAITQYDLAISANGCEMTYEQNCSLDSCCQTDDIYCDEPA